MRNQQESQNETAFVVYVHDQKHATEVLRKANVEEAKVRAERVKLSNDPQGDHTLKGMKVVSL